MPTTVMPSSLAPLAALARKQKSVAVRNPHTEGAVLHIVELERAGRRILRAGFPEPDELLGAVAAGVPMVAADVVAIAADSFTTVKAGDAGLINPITGKPWRLGDMNEIAEKDLAVERGILAEGLSLMRFNRDGTWLAGTLRYTHDRKRRRLLWGEVTCWDGHESDHLAEQLDMQARFPAVIRKAFAAEPAVACGDSATPEERDLVAGVQHGLDVDFARQVEEIGVLLEGPF